jgi:hypothetical protein
VRFPGQIPERLVIADELKGNVIDLEGRELVVVEVGHTDTDHTTFLHDPTVGLVVAGDAYNTVGEPLMAQFLRASMACLANFSGTPFLDSFRRPPGSWPDQSIQGRLSVLIGIPSVLTLRRDAHQSFCSTSTAGAIYVLFMYVGSRRAA